MLKSVEKLSTLLCRRSFDTQTTSQQASLHEEHVQALTFKKRERATDSFLRSRIPSSGQCKAGIKQVPNGPPHQSRGWSVEHGPGECEGNGGVAVKHESALYSEQTTDRITDSDPLVLGGRRRGQYGGSLVHCI